MISFSFFSFRCFSEVKRLEDAFVSSDSAESVTEGIDIVAVSIPGSGDTKAVQLPIENIEKQKDERKQKYENKTNWNKKIINEHELEETNVKEIEEGRRKKEEEKSRGR